MLIRKFDKSDLNQMIKIWNDIVSEGNAFPQEDILNLESGFEFFSYQSFTGVAVIDGQIVGLYILHPNNVGRCSHIANASYAVDAGVRGKHIGKSLVLDSIERARELNFKILQFNAVVESNASARHLYESLGFKQLGTIPNGFRLKDGTYENICPYFIEL
ncbi:MAG: GNAT family N-acetyltransferase [Methanobrevibacter sp.]|uniref:GNAT family N-acetyltransferase n=1 Tax=Methanobrevibacter sp. TaxID=66852 RepID=UPI0025CF057F|nr:GNAT family N-acetyltransferase [Methanobrevibacter sp.]MBR0271234.1 GNAT family N-acetyltransferase [Methanobrevibacter sp.]